MVQRLLSGAEALHLQSAVGRACARGYNDINGTFFATEHANGQQLDIKAHYDGEYYAYDHDEDNYATAKLPTADIDGR